MTKRKKPYFPRCCNTIMSLKQIHKKIPHGETIIVELKCSKCGNIIKNT